MRISTCVLLTCLSTVVLAADETRTKKKDDRTTRSLDYTISHRYGSSLNQPLSTRFRLERRISSNGPHHSLNYPQFFPGPRPYSSYRKGRPFTYPIPSYAVQMEPLVHYSQRDPLYDTNLFSLNTDGHNDLTKVEDLLTDNNHVSESVYGVPASHSYNPPHRIIERPVYIKEPEPIIEIIIKESNVSLPPPPTTPAPKKKKEQVQVFYVKYKKNPHSNGKDSVIYDKPVPALTPHVPEEDEEEHEPEVQPHYEEPVTYAPPPSTTLRTIIKPDSETYHSSSGIKVTFGKEGWEHDKRQSKPDDYQPDPRPHIQFPQPPPPPVPQGRQLSPYSNNYFKRNPILPNNFQNGPPPNFRPTPDYRQFNQFNSNPQNGPPPFKQFSRPGPPRNFAGPPFHKNNNQFNGNFQPNSFQNSQPPQQNRFQPSQLPPNYSSDNRQPVPYTPFDSYKQQPSGQANFHQNQFRQEPPLNQNHNFNAGPPALPQLPVSGPNGHFQPHPAVRNEDLLQHEIKPQANPNHSGFNQNPNQYSTINLQQNNHNFNGQNQGFGNNHQQDNIHQTAQNLFPAGGELIHSLPKFEQHISVLEPNKKPNQNEQQFLSQNEYQQKIKEQFHQQPQQSSQSGQQHNQYNTQYQVQRNQQNFQQQDQPRPVFQQQKPSQTSQYQPQQQALSSHENIFDEHIKRFNPASSSTPNTIYYTTKSTTPKNYYSSTTTRPTSTTTTEEPEKPSTTTNDPKVLNAKLPDEVPDELRAQLLSSGILNNADISVLDYDKVGDIPLSALPPDQLANFYSAGGGAQISAGSEPVPSIVRSQIEKRTDQEAASSERQDSPSKVEMKVVHYNPDTNEGQQVQDKYIEEDARQTEPVVLNGGNYNRYLPLKVNGTQFPIPDVPELKGKKISSVVVLAPLSYDFSSERKTRATSEITQEELDLIQSDDLKELVKDPTRENYKKFLEKQNRTTADKQAVILLVAGTKENKEIFMYDVSTKMVNKLNGELSSAFVNAAEANAINEIEEGQEQEVSSSNIVETRVLYDGEPNTLSYRPIEDQFEGAAFSEEPKVPIIDPMDGDLETEASEQLNSFIDISNLDKTRKNHDDLAVSATHHNPIKSDKTKRLYAANYGMKTGQS